MNRLKYKSIITEMIEIYSMPCTLCKLDKGYHILIKSALHRYQHADTAW